MGKSKAKGTAFERLVADHLADRLDDRIDRRALNGSRDRGDIGGIRFFGHRIAVECKNHKSMDLSGWVNQADAEAGNDDALLGVVVHKRARKGRAEDQYVTMTLESFTRLLECGVR